MLSYQIYKYIVKLLWNEYQFQVTSHKYWKWLVSCDLVCWEFHSIVRSLNSYLRIVGDRSFDALVENYQAKYIPFQQIRTLVISNKANIDRYKYYRKKQYIQNLQLLTSSLESLHSPFSSLVIINSIPTLKRLHLHCNMDHPSKLLKLKKRVKATLQQHWENNSGINRTACKIEHFELSFENFETLRVSSVALEQWIDAVFSSNLLSDVHSITLSDSFDGILFRVSKLFFDAIERRSKPPTCLSIKCSHLPSNNNLTNFYSSLQCYLMNRDVYAAKNNNNNLVTLSFNREISSMSFVRYLLTECTVQQLNIAVPCKLITSPLTRHFSSLTLSLNSYRFQVSYEPMLNIDDTDIFQSLNQVDQLSIVIDYYGYEYNSKIQRILKHVFELNTESSLISTEIFLDDAPAYDQHFTDLLKAIDHNHQLKQVEFIVKSVSIPLHHLQSKLERLNNCINNHPTITNKSKSIKILPYS